MRFLLDTHALLWWVYDDTRLGAATRKVLSDESNGVLVSAVSLWEIVVKVRSGKLGVDIGEVMQAAASGGLASLAIAPAHLLTLATLPRHHRDPFDHPLIAQAIAEGAVLVSNDRRIPAYPVQFIPC